MELTFIMMTLHRWCAATGGKDLSDEPCLVWSQWASCWYGGMGILDDPCSVWN